MRVVLVTWGSRGDVEPMVGLAVQLRALGAEVRVCAPPDFAELLARVGVPLIPMGVGARDGARREAADAGGGGRRTAASLVAMQFETVAAAAEGCDAVVATGLMPGRRRGRSPRSWASPTCSRPSPRLRHAVAAPLAAAAAGQAVSAGR